MPNRLEILQDLLKSSPEDGFIQFAIAKEYEKQNDYFIAIEWLYELIKKDENYVGAYYHLAKLLEHEEKHEAALTIYDQGLRVAKNLGDQHAYAELKNARLNLELGL